MQHPQRRGAVGRGRLTHCARCGLRVLEFDKGIVRQQDRRIFVDGGEVELTPSEGLFLTDQLAATASILDGTESYIPMEQILDGLSVADLVMGVS